MHYTTSGTTDRLIDYLDQIMRENGSELPCTKEALRAFSKGKRGDVDCFDLMNLDNESFRDALFMRCFNRFPSRQYTESWEEKTELPRDVFQKEYIEALSKDPRFVHAQVKLHNCIYLDPSVYKIHLAFIRQFTGIIYSAFRPFYLRLPMGIRMQLKKQFRKYFF